MLTLYKNKRTKQLTERKNNTAIYTDKTIIAAMCVWGGGGVHYRYIFVINWGDHSKQAIITMMYVLVAHLLGKT